MTELYSKMAQDTKARLAEAERVGYGFRLDVEDICEDIKNQTNGQNEGEIEATA